MKLATITNTHTWQSTSLVYIDSGELTSATLPYGGLLEWVYSDFLYASKRKFREVTTRYLTSKPGVTRWQYEIVQRAMGFGWPARQTATLLHDAGVTLAREGRFVEARELFRTAVLWAPEVPEYRRSLALVLDDRPGGRSH